MFDCALRSVSSLAIAMFATTGNCAVTVKDAPAPVFDTKLEIADHTGAMLWISDRVLAVTTSSKVGEFWNGTVVAVDASSGKKSTLIDAGFLQCTSPADGTVAILKGSLAKRYRGDVASNATPDPVQVLYKWDGVAGRLVSEEDARTTNRNWHICVPTPPKDKEISLLGFYDKGVRYLRLEDGRLHWSENPSPRSSHPVFLVKPGGGRSRVDVLSTEISLLPEYRPEIGGYLLSLGTLATGEGRLSGASGTAKQTPVITLSTDGAITRHFLANEIVEYLDAGGTNLGSTFPLANGLLLALGGWQTTRSGLYKVQGQAATRIWCTLGDSNTPKCSLRQLVVSPGGCYAALVPIASPSTVRIIDLCKAQ